MTKYMEAIKAYFDGYDDNGKAIYSPYPRSREYIEGKYRPIYGKIKLFSSKNISARNTFRQQYIRVPATRENIRKQLEWNLSGSESYQRYAIKTAKRLGIKLSRMTVN